MKTLGASGRDNFIAAVSMVSLATVSVFLRFVARLSARLSLTWADWLALLGLACMAVYSGLLINYIVAGPGPGTFDLNEITMKAEVGGTEWGVALLKTLYVADLFFAATISMAKFSLLAFYHSIFSISKVYQRWNQGAAALCVAWMVASLFLNAFQCRPPSMLWKAMGSAEYCLASGKLWLGTELTNLFLDVLVLCLPLVKVKGLNLPTYRKIAIGGILLLGGLVCIASMVKLAYTWQPETPEFVGVPNAMVWSSVQLGVAILCACLPTYAPLVHGARKRMGLSSPDSTKPLGYSNNPTTSRSHNGSRVPGLISKDSVNGDIAASPYYRVHDRPLASPASQESYPLDRLGPNSIHVKRTIDVS